MDDIIGWSVNIGIDVEQKYSLPFLLEPFYFNSVIFLDIPQWIESHMAIGDTLK